MIEIESPFTPEQLAAKARPTPDRLRRQLTERRIKPGAGMTLPKRFPRLLRTGGEVHIVGQAAAVWVDTSPTWGVKLKCGLLLIDPQFGDPARSEVSCIDCQDPTNVYYFLRDHDGLIKIGRAQNVERRFNTLARTHGVSSILAVERRVPERREAERHRQFAHLRMVGEWFNPGPDLLTHIDNIASPGRHLAVAQ